MGQKDRNKQKTQDEQVNGAKIAADILRAMPTASRERLLKAVETQDPSILVKITDNLFNFNDIASLTSQGIQTLIAAVDQKDLVFSLKTASVEVKEALFANMSERKSRMITEDLQSLGKVKLSEVEECQRRILKILDDLRTAGQIRSESKKDIWV